MPMSPVERWQYPLHEIPEGLLFSGPLFGTTGLTNCRESFAMHNIVGGTPDSRPIEDLCGRGLR